MRRFRFAPLFLSGDIVKMTTDKINIRQFNRLNWVLEIKSGPTEKNPDGKWVINGYYGKIEHMAPALLNLLLTSPSPDVDLLAQINNLVKQVKKAEDNISIFLKEIAKQASNGDQ